MLRYRSGEEQVERVNAVPKLGEVGGGATTVSVPFRTCLSLWHCQVRGLERPLLDNCITQKSPSTGRLSRGAIGSGLADRRPRPHSLFSG